MHSEMCSGGGVLIAVRTTFDCDIVEIRDTQGIECVAVRVALPGSDLYCYCAYMPPRDPIEKYLSHMRAIECVSELMGPTDRFLVCGDFNLSVIVTAS